MIAKSTSFKVLLCSFLLLFTNILFAQQRTVTGKITDPNNLPVPGATVSVSGSIIATETDANGSFSIAVPNGKNSLTITSVGFEPQTINVSKESNVVLSLKTTTSTMNEVVVTGYGTQRKKDITGSVAVVNITNLKQIPTGTPEQALQGQVAGVQIVTSGMPGAGSTIRVRGISSQGNINPLIIVDGTPGSMHDLNVNDIESIQVLKDAGAAAIYGVRGSNGVIVVTTKKGRSGKIRFNYDAYYGTQRPLKNGFNIANTSETGQAYYQSYINSGSDFTKNVQFGRGATTGPVIPLYITPSAGLAGEPNTDPAKYSLYTNQITLANQQGTDWFHEIFQPAPIQSHSISVSSGSDRSSFYMSLGYFNQTGTLIETYLKRYSARINTQFALANNHIRIGENAFVFYRDNPGINNQNEGNAISMSYRESPIIPVYDIMGNYAGTLSKGLGNAQNPVAIMRRTHDNHGGDYQIQGNAFGEVDLFNNFTARTQFGGTIDNYNNRFFSYTAYENGENNQNPNSFTEQLGYNSSWTWTNTLNYSNTFLGKHNVKVLVGSESIQNYGRAIQGNRSGYFITNAANLTVDPNLWTLNFGPPTGQTTANINGTPYQNTLFSLFGRIDYNYDDKYLLAGTIRRDGSSLFAQGHRYGWFPSVSGAWRISRESFFPKTSSINELKLRGGWGKLGSNINVSGNNAYDLYGQSASRSYYDIAGSNSSSTFGIYPQQIGNAATTWEEDIITNVGLDATLLKNKIDFSIEWYKKAISGLLFTPLAYTGSNYASQPAVNAGNIQNTGIDAAITYHGIVKHDINFDITGTFTSYNNKVISLPAGIQYYDFNSAGSSRIGAFTRLQPGHPVGAFFGYQVVGLFQDAADVAKSPTQSGAEAGLLKFADINGDGKIDANDRTFFGNPNPDFTAGLNIGLRYKAFDLSTFLYASVGNDVINYVRYWTDFPQVFEGAVSKDAVYNSWTPQNLNARVPKLTRTANFSNTLNVSSYYMENGSYLRMKSLILGYTLPKSLLSRFRIERLRIYVQAANLFTITKYTGLDPELTPSNSTFQAGGFGIDFGNYPSNQKNYNVGINLSF